MCEAILMWNQWKLFEKMTKALILTYFGTQNGPKIGPLRPMFPQTAESSCNEHVKQQCTWKTFMIHQTFVWWAFHILFIFVKSLIRHLGLAIGYVRCVRGFSWTLKQYWCETSESFLRRWPKSRILTYFWGAKVSPKLDLWDPYCTHLWK